jgi:hypothetical protein
LELSSGDCRANWLATGSEHGSEKQRWKELG